MNGKRNANVIIVFNIIPIQANGLPWSIESFAAIFLSETMPKIIPTAGMINSAKERTDNKDKFVLVGLIMPSLNLIVFRILLSTNAIKSNDKNEKHPFDSGAKQNDEIAAMITTFSQWSPITFLVMK